MIWLLACTAPPVLEVALSETDPHAAVLTLDGSGTVECVGAHEIHRLEVDHTAVARGLLAGSRYACVATVGGKESAESFVDTPALPDGLPTARVVTEADPADVGFHLVNVSHINSQEETVKVGLSSDQFLAVYDARGQVRWHLAGVGGSDTDATWLGDTVLYGGFDGWNSEDPTEVDLDGNVVMAAVDSEDSTWNSAGEWSHDAGISEDGTAIWAIELESVPDPDHPEEEWESFTVERLDRETGVTDWAWSAYGDGVAGGWLEAGRAADREPYHPNSVWDEGDRIFVSLHNEDAILAIDVATREVLWRLGEGGDFTLLDAEGNESDDWFYGQHDVKVIGDRVFIYDNGLFGRETSRALVLRIDEAARVAQIETSWWGEGWYTPVWGGVDLRDDDTLDVTIGTVWWVNPGEDDHSSLVWLEPDGAGDATERWRIEFPNRETGIYRSDRIDGCAAFDIVDYCTDLQ